jgi:hypothetical protein
LTTSQKAIISLVISTLLFAAFSVVAFTGLFDLLGNRFYNPSITTYAARENRRNAEIANELFIEMENYFFETLKTQEVKDSFISNQNQDALIARANFFKHLIELYEGIQWIRFIDTNGRRLLFSTYSPDIIWQDEFFTSYREFSEPNLPYEMIAVADGGKPKCTFDEYSERILFSFPLHDTSGIYWGTALFSITMDAVVSRLVRENLMISGQSVMIILNPPGLVFGSYASSDRVLPTQVSSAWRVSGQKTIRLESPYSGNQLVLISSTTPQGLFIARLISENQLSFPPAMKIILLASFFLTVFLISFLIFSFKQDRITIIQSRLKQLQISLLEQLYELKDESDWKHWTEQLEQRQKEISSQLKQGLKNIPDNLNAEIDTIISRSWEEFLSLAGNSRETSINEEKLKAIFTSILSSLPALGSGALAEKDKTGLLMRAQAIVQEIDDAELVEELGEPDEDDPRSSPAISQNAKDDLAYLASQIEFSTTEEPDITIDESIEHDLEIVSPFSSMLDNFSQSESGGDEDDSAFLEQVAESFAEHGEEENGDDNTTISAIQNRGLVIMNKPFSGMAGSTGHKTLESVPQDKGKNIIKERGGVPYISGDTAAGNSDGETVLDRNFKNLVDSVIK